MGPYSALIAIIGVVVGAVLTYLLTSSRELNAYKRERLEQCGFCVNELAKSLANIQTILVTFLTSDKIPQNDIFDSNKEREIISNKAHDCDVFIMLHAQKLMPLVEDYSSAINKWIKMFKELPKDGSTNQELANEFVSLYQDITNVQDKIYEALACEIYGQSYHTRMLNWIKSKILRNK